MSDLSEVLSLIPVDEIARQLGVSTEVAQSAVEQAVPTVLGGMQANATTGGAGSLEAALGQHVGQVGDGPVPLKTVDTSDGEAIVRHVFGGNTEQVAAAVADKHPATEVTKDIIAKVLPIVAPIVIAWLANKFFGGKKQEEAAAAQEESTTGLGGILGGLLGGGSTAGAASGGGIGDLLGGLLGGSSAGSSASGGLDSILGGLGGLLGGGTK